MHVARRQVKAPDGREWVVTGHGRSLFPPWRVFNPHPRGYDMSTSYKNQLIGDIVIGSLIGPLIIWIIELPIAIVRAFLPIKAVVEAKDRSKPPARMRWKVEQRHAKTAVEEVAKQLEAGAQSIQLADAEFVG